MLKNITLFFNKDIDRVPASYINEFLEERLSINFYREKIYAIILIIWNSLMFVYIGFGAFDGTWIRIPAYKYELILHIVGLLFAALFFWLFKSNHKLNKDSMGFCDTAFTAFILQFCTIMTLIDLSINQQMVVFTIGAIVTSVSLIMTPKRGFLNYISAYGVLVIGTYLTQNSRELIESSILNGLIMSVLGIVISKMIFSFFVNDFLKSKELQEKTTALENSHKMLEGALLERTKELETINEQLIQEMKTRHEMEIHSLKADLIYQKKLTALNKAMEFEQIRGEFFTNITHDLRTPLKIIFCSLQMLNTSLNKNAEMLNKEKLTSYVTLMKQNSYRLLRLINNIIDITKIDSGYLRVNLANHNIVGIIENIAISVTQFAEYNSIKVNFETEMREKVIACDPDKIERIVLNLLSNAFKFTDRGGSISINVYEKKGYVGIKIKDTGIGIPQEKQKIIFDRFIQANKSNRHEKEGSGIGLSLVKSLIAMHNGNISLTSEQGKGSEFTIKLPNVVVEGTNSPTASEKIRPSGNTEIINIEFADVYHAENI